MISCMIVQKTRGRTLLPDAIYPDRLGGEGVRPGQEGPRT